MPADEVATTAAVYVGGISEIILYALVRNPNIREEITSVINESLNVKTVDAFLRKVARRGYELLMASQ
jgi:hypothetical protein